MTQKIGIDVHANTGGAESGVRKIDVAASNAAESVSEIAAEADKAAAGLDKLASKADKVADTAKRASEAAIRQAQYTVQRLTELQKQLQAVLGRPISMEDARIAAGNFESARAGKKFRGRTVQDADDYVDYLATAGLAATNNGHRRAYRNEVVFSSMKGTNAARQGGLTPPNEPNPPRQGGSDIVQRAQSSAMSFGKSMLALAGITSIMGMAAQAVDMATEEAVTLDTLKRRAGDLGVSFDKLQEQTRAAGEGMGLTYVESARLAQQYAKVAGNLGSPENLRTSIGFSRSFGLDPSEGTQFFATMQRYRAAGADDQGSRRLALMIGEAVSKSGYPAKADELLGAVANFASDIARQTLTRPNVEAYAGYLTTLMSQGGYVGSGPDNSAAILNKADQASRGGGGMGDASKNFEFAALRNGSPGLDVYQAMALMQQGLFGTTASTFGNGSPLGDLWGSGGLKHLDNVTNLQKYMTLFQQMYGKNLEAMTDGMVGHFGLSYQQAGHFIQMAQSGPTALTDTLNLVKAAHLDPMKISGTGFSGLNHLAAAHDLSAMTAVYSELRGRKDITLSGQESGNIEGLLRGGKLDDARIAMAKIIGTHDQEPTKGSETRDAIAELKNELTKVGGLLIGPINDIKTAVVATAEALAPAQYRIDRQREKDASTDFHAAYGAGGSTAALDSDIAATKARIDAARKAGKTPSVDDIAPRPNAREVTYGGWMGFLNTPGAYSYDMARRQAVAKYLGDAGAMAPDQWRNYMSGTDKLLHLPRGFSARQIMAESTFRPGQDNPLSGAMGLAQVMPNTLAGLNARLGRQLDPHDPMDSLLIHRLVMQEKLQAEHGNLREALLDYGGFISPAKRNGPDAQAYLDKILGHNTPMPAGGKAGDGGHQVHVTVGIQNGELIHKDSAGRSFASTPLKPFVQHTSGVSAPWTVTGDAG